MPRSASGGVAPERAVAPQPGWYPDPNAKATLRLWDGRNWTQDTRAAPGHSRRPRPSSILVAAAAVGVVAITLFFAFRGGERAHLASAPPTTTTLPKLTAGTPPRTSKCTLATQRPPAADLISWLSATESTVGPPVDVTPPSDGCSAAVWVDLHTRVKNLVVSYPTSATAAAAAARLGAGPFVFAEGIYLVAMDKLVGANIVHYRAKVARFAAGADAYTGSPPTTVSFLVE
jgi:hypothetical protein